MFWRSARRPVARYLTPSRISESEKEGRPLVGALLLFSAPRTPCVRAMTDQGREIVAGLVIIGMIIVAYLLVFYAAALIIDILGLDVIADIPAAGMT